MEQFQINNSVTVVHDLDIHLFADEVDKLIIMRLIDYTFYAKIIRPIWNVLRYSK